MIEYRPEDDSLYVNISDGTASVWSSRSLDERRTVDYAEDSSVIAVLFANVSLGIELAGLPEGARVLEALQALKALLRDIAGEPEPGACRSGRVG